MDPLTFDQYADVVRRSGLVSADRLNALLETFTRGELPTDPLPLAQALVQARLITPWQHKHLAKGRWQGFFLGEYRILRDVAAGGMGAIYLAEHVMTGRRVAIKVLSEAWSDRETVARFQIECRATLELNHKNIVKAHEVNKQGKCHYLVMEYVDGANLENIVLREGPLDYARAAGYIRQACRGLSHAHRAGIVHRDVKPANLLLNSKGVIKLSDLGVARVLEQSGYSLTQASNQAMLGTLEYLAPEQAIDSHDVDERADIYGLGATLYFLITGHPPFEGPTPEDRLMALQAREPKSIYDYRSDAPSELVAICRRMMAKEPCNRYRTAEEVEQALAHWLQPPDLEVAEYDLSSYVPRFQPDLLSKPDAEQRSGE